MTLIHNPSATKKATNLSINSELLALAKQYKINLSKLLEERMDEVVREKIAKQWQEENRSAIIEYNEQVQKHGLFGDEYRSF